MTKQAQYFKSKFLFIKGIMKKIGVLRFPGANCDLDIFHSLKALSYHPHWLWHKDRFDPQHFDGFVIPGGFSFGDYLRPGILAARSLALQDLIKASQEQKPILGICNGFQILCEASLLPGALLPNISLRFVDKFVRLQFISHSSFWQVQGAQYANLPIAHGEGRFFAQPNTLKSIEDNGQIWLKYTRNPNGSLQDIAGIFNKTKNVAALMPHPERAIFAWMGSQDGQSILKCF